ncbi:MAG: ATP-binding protein, partial [Spirochaetota bacterium]
VNDILDFSKLKNKDIILKQKPIDIYTTAEVVLSFCKTLIKGKPISIYNKIKPDLPPVYADEERLQQVFYNLIGNAIKFTHKGNITLKSSTIYNDDGNTEMMEISISDTGIGIDNDRIEDIFKSFEQIDTSIEKEYGGSGLGLTISKRLIELQGGNISIESKKDEGTTVYFTLPLSKETDRIKIEDKQNKNNKKELFGFDIQVFTEDKELDKIEPITKVFKKDKNNYNILIVDDDPINIQVIENYLTIEGYGIVKALSGQEALDIISEQEINLILLDLMLPKMNGFKISKKIRENHSPAELPIIILTARRQNEDTIIAFEFGVNDYLTKPISKKELIARIKLHINLAEMNLEYKNAEQQIKKLNEELEHKVRKRTEELNKAYKELKTFTYRVSHDLRNPISIIKGYKDVLKRKYSEQIEDEKFNYVLDKIDSTTNYMYEIIDNLFTLSSVKHKELNFKKFNLSYTINETVNTYKTLYKTDKVDINIEEDIWISADKQLIQIMMDNLIGNAFKYSINKEVTVIEFGTVKNTNDIPLDRILDKINKDELENKTIYFIKDKGTGFKMKYYDKLFQPFERLHTPKEFKGTGIGLATVETIVNRHNGYIWAYSEEDKETTFYFILD